MAPKNPVNSLLTTLIRLEKQIKISFLGRGAQCRICLYLTPKKQSKFS